MKNQFISFLFLLSLVFGVSAQKTSETEKSLRTHVSYLASDSLEGRRTGERGATSAAGYVANSFAKYKLKAGAKSQNGKANFLQQFPYVSALTLGKGNFLEFKSKESDKKLQLKLIDEWMPLGFSGNAVLENLPLVNVGYGITAKNLNYDDYRGIDVKNSAVLAVDDAPDRKFEQYADIRRKALAAREAGAKVLIILTDVSQEKYQKLRYDNSGDAGLPVIVVSAESFSKTEDFTVSVSVELIRKNADAYNVVGILEGKDPQLKNEAIVIGAHYDHLGKGGLGSLDVNSNEIHHGADDNASGVSAMLELASRFAKEKNNKRTLIFIAFGGEEEGLLGSKFYVNNPVFPLDKTVAMINMDMVGRLNENKLTIGGIGTASEWKILVEKSNSPNIPTKAELEYVMAKQGSKQLFFSLQLNEDGFGPSDHSSFYGKQIPVLFFFTGTHSDYHKPSDTFDKINYDGLIRITNYVDKIVRSIDENSTKPTYTVAKSSGMMGGESRGGFNISLGTVPSYSEGDNTGLLLDGVRDNSPAAKAGIKAGDKIIRLAGVDIKNISDYVSVIRGEMKPDEEYEVIVMRGSEKLTLKITPVKR